MANRYKEILMSDSCHDFDFIVIGSGFGGSVTAHRLTGKGYRVAVMEMGRRWRAEDFPKTNWHIWRWFWRPRLALRGFFAAADGVVDSRNRFFGYRNMYICDGSVLAANLGVNPSLTICAVTERAMSYIRPAAETGWNDAAQ